MAPIRNQNRNRWVSPKGKDDEEPRSDVGQVAKPATRILIVDRDSMSSDLLANALGRDRNFESVAVQSGDVLGILATSPVDLLVIAADLQANSRNGFDLAHTISRDYPNVFIVLLFNHSNHDSVINAFRSGARGVFSRTQPMAEFLDCVEHVSRGLIWAGSQETDILLQAFRSIPALNITNEDDSPTLTVREMNVVQCAAKGKTNKAIASELGLSEHTVKNYLFRAFEKLGVSSRVELLFYLTQRGHSFATTKPVCADAELIIDQPLQAPPDCGG
jgi:two-component system, NarL family, nitrate/nitrite response regulator NarL